MPHTTLYAKRTAERGKDYRYSLKLVSARERQEFIAMQFASVTSVS